MTVFCPCVELIPNRFHCFRERNTIFKAVKLILAKLLGRYELFGLYLVYTRGYLFEMGWFESFRAKQAIGRDGKPIPWITYPCLSFLEERLESSMNAFEYGCGNSTLWWASRVQRVVSCEHDQSWYAEVKKALPSNVELHHIPLERDGAYSRLVAKFHREFDVIFIDGRDRVNCIKQSLGALRPNGVVILDNSDVSEYSEGLQFLLSNNYKFLHFRGPGPINSTVWRTTIFL